MKSAQKSYFISATLASLLVMAGCATSIDEPVDQAPVADQAIATNAERLQPPEKPANNPVRLAIPVAGDTAQLIAEPTATNKAGADPLLNEPADLPTDSPMQPVSLIATTAQADVQPPAQANDLSLLTNTNVTPGTEKTHHQSEDISVITWRAERGHVPSQLLLGEAYFHGNGVAKDLEQSRLWLELASMQGDKTAQYKLGQMYFTGTGVRQDYLNAREWWLESAISGNDKAQQKLGYLYSEGLGVKRDFNKARSWYVKAANLGNAEAQTLLGSLFHEGNRLKTDYNEAFRWYQLAAHQGHPHAQYALGILHHDGLGTEQDYVKCAAWVEVALANNYTDELGAGDMCRAKLDAQSNAAADSLASLWKSRYLPANKNTAF